MTCNIRKHGLSTLYINIKREEKLQHQFHYALIYMLDYLVNLYFLSSFGKKKISI